MSDNVIVGPWGELEIEFEPEPTVDALDEYVYTLAEIIFEEMRDVGFDNLGEIQYAKDLGMITEAIRSYLMKLQDRYHPVQDIADAFFALHEKEEQLEIMPSVDVVFRDFEL